jgi:lipoprotein-anchoring transpeptidase ErfK/SrfK
VRRALTAAGVVAVIVVASGHAHTQPGTGPSVLRGPIVAYAHGSRVFVYASEGSGRVRQVLSSPTDDGAVLSFLVRSLHARRALVYLPTRPNGSSGWVPRSQVRVYAEPYRVRIDLRRHTLAVRRFGSVILHASVGVGRAVTPTPAGTYYIVSRIQPPDPRTVYGAFAFGLSAHSNVFARFGFGGDGRIGLHGTNDPAGVGHDVSHGCIRTTNAVILRLARLLPLGTPITITRA